MATVYGVNATKSLNSTIPTLQLVGQNGGVVKSMYDIYTFLAEATSGDILKMGSKLPEGARVVDCRLIFGALANSSAFDVGWAAGASAVEVGDADGFGATVSTTSAGVYSMFTSQSTRPGQGKVFTESAQLQLACTTTTTTATAKTISVEIFYVID